MPPLNKDNICKCGKGKPTMSKKCDICSNPSKLEYDRNHSHIHCWDQKRAEEYPACGQPLAKHKQCCLCDTPYPSKLSKKESANFMQVGKGHCFICHRNTYPGDNHDPSYCYDSNPTSACLDTCEEKWRNGNPNNPPHKSPEWEVLREEFVKGDFRKEFNKKGMNGWSDAHYFFEDVADWKAGTY